MGTSQKHPGTLGWRWGQACRRALKNDQGHVRVGHLPLVCPSSDSPCSRQHHLARGAAEHPECCHTRLPVQGDLLPRGFFACSCKVLVIFPGVLLALFPCCVIRAGFVDQVVCFSSVSWCWHPKPGGKPELEPVPGHQPCWWLLRDKPIPWLWSDLCDLLRGSSEELLLWAVTCILRPLTPQASHPHTPQNHSRSAL